MTPQVLAADAHLFPPRPAYRFRPITAPSSPYDDPTIGENPEYGASINYHLKSALPGPVKVTILDQKGEVVRTLSAPAGAGLIASIGTCGTSRPARSGCARVR